MIMTETILNKILTQLKLQGKAKGRQNDFLLKEIQENNIVLERANGKDVGIPFSTLRKVIAACVEDSSFYDGGLKAIENIGVNHIQSPVWVLLHLLEKREYMKELNIGSHRIYKMSMGIFKNQKVYRDLGCEALFEEKGFLVMGDRTGKGQAEELLDVVFDFGFPKESKDILRFERGKMMKDITEQVDVLKILTD